MKGIILLLISFVFSFSINAQSNFQLKEVPEIVFDTKWHADTTSLFSIVPKFKMVPPQKFNFTPNAPENLYGQYLKKEHLQTKKYIRYDFKMPIAKPSVGDWNMPIVVPDYAVNYSIKELRIETIDKIKEPKK